MNFNDLYKKINAIDSGKSLTECNMTECGGDMMAGMQSHPQQDSVNMNITLSGQGSGGIRDIMDILRNIDKPAQDAPSNDDSMMIGSQDDGEFQSPNIDDMMVIQHSDMEEPEHDHEEPDEIDSDEQETDETYGNSVMGGADKDFYKMAAVTAVGDDFASKGGSFNGKPALKVNGGENPINESLISHLHKLYQEVKQR